MTTYPRLVAGVSLITGNRAAAEDAVQEALGARLGAIGARGEDRIEHAPSVIGPTLVPVSDQIAWGAPVTQPEGAYCIDGASGTGDPLKSDVENSYDVPDVSKLPEGGGATLCGAPVVP